MEERIFMKKKGELNIDDFLSEDIASSFKLFKDKIKLIENREKEYIEDFMRARDMLKAAMELVKKSAPHAYFGEKNMGMDYSTGHYKGSREMELYFYTRHITIPREEFIFNCPAPIPEELLKRAIKYGEVVLPPEPMGTGFDIWANDCYGRCSKIMAAPNGFVDEEIHGRARILLRDPVKVLRNLPQNKKQHDFQYALDDEELMKTIKDTDQFDELILQCRSYEQLVGVLNKALNAAQTA